jgi:hypothetical protein
MSALVRYQAGILFRSHRWVFPLITYVILLSVAGVGQKQPLSEGLDWSAAVLLPVVALATRSMLTAEPGAARSCTAAARGPVRPQLAVLFTALVAGMVLGLAGAGYEIVTSQTGPELFGRHAGAAIATLGAGLGKALICAFVGSAVGTLCNPPVVRHQAIALLSTVAAVVLALVASVSPANAALRGSGATIQASDWPTGVPFLAALALIAAAWAISAWMAARRGS